MSSTKTLFEVSAFETDSDNLWNDVEAKLVGEDNFFVGEFFPL